jgi:hypothetical protein
MKPLDELDARDLVNLLEESAITWDRLLGEPCPPDGRPASWKRKTRQLEKEHGIYYAELLHRLGWPAQEGEGTR